MSKQSLVLAKKQWEQARDKASLEHEAFHLFSTTSQGLIRTLPVGPTRTMATAEIKKWLEDHGTRYREALKELARASDDYRQELKKAKQVG